MKPEYPAGTQFKYDCGNTLLLGLILERALQGKTVTDYLQAHCSTQGQILPDQSVINPLGFYPHLMHALSHSVGSNNSLGIPHSPSQRLIDSGLALPCHESLKCEANVFNSQHRTHQASLCMSSSDDVCMSSDQYCALLLLIHVKNDNALRRSCQRYFTYPVTPNLSFSTNRNLPTHDSSRTQPETPVISLYPPLIVYTF